MAKQVHELESEPFDEYRYLQQQNKLMSGDIFATADHVDE